jgi:hypothetical protein
MRKKTIYFLGLLVILTLVGLFVANYSLSCPHRQKDCESKKDCLAMQNNLCDDLLNCDNLPCPGIALDHKSELSLTDDQATNLKNLYLGTKKEKIQNNAEIKILKLEAADLLDQKVVDNQALEAKIDEIAKLMAKRTKDCIQSRLKTRQILSEEQLKKMESLKASCFMLKANPTASGQESQTLPHKRCQKM